MKYKYDFHIHSCLSPCGDNDMTPNNIVNMMSILNCDIMAITDHNTCRNAKALIEVGKSVGVLVIAGMELCTSEEAHVLCLFENVEKAMEFDKFVYERIPDIQNEKEIFGNQFELDENDEFVAEEEKLLLTATDISCEEICEIVKNYAGVAIPAHVNKDSYSLIASLGTIPQECNFHTIELTKDMAKEDFIKMYPELESYEVIRNSDAHYLENIPDEFDEIELQELSSKAVIEHFAH